MNDGTKVSGTAVSEIAGLATRAAEPRLIEAAGTSYVVLNGQLHDPRKKDPVRDVVKLHTLTGLAEFIRANRDEIPLEKAVIHVEGPARVSLLGSVFGEFKQREVYAVAESFDRFAGMPGGFQFGQFMDRERMHVALQALFEAAGQRADLLTLIGNITDESAVKVDDDGQTQRVNVRAGLSMAGSAAVPNPVLLAPWRTFTEIDQPLSPFVFRTKKGQDGVLAALFEADGGAWRIEAVQNIRMWLDSWLADARLDIAVVA